MRKALITGIAAFALLGSSLAYAQQQPAPEATQHHKHWQMSEADFNALTDARLAALKAGLQLTPEQEKNWPAVEKQIREMAKARFQRKMQMRSEQRPTDAILRLRERADALTRRADRLRKLADTAAPLYESLTEDQKHRLRFLIPMVMMHHHMGHFARWEHEHHEDEHHEHEGEHQ
jgi:zinc resistance-associated protein